MSATVAQETLRTPTVFFIDDSATMREVIKIAFRREHMDVVACHDAATALAQIEKSRPDVVITDVIMPDKDGYEVCQFIKQHPWLDKTPVVLLSGVVNRDVAEKAFNVKADELVRKPFQPQDLIARVKQLLAPKTAEQPATAVPQAPAPSPKVNGSALFGAKLSGIFNGGAAKAAPVMPPAALTVAPVISVAPPVPALSAVPPPPAASKPAPGRAAATPDVQKLRVEVLRLENLVRKLQAELAAEREYARALEAHVKTLQEAE